MLADGNSRDRAVLGRVLEGAGYRVELAATGDEALAAARRETPLAAVLDVALSRLCGYEVCRSLREAFGNTLPVILVSATRTKSYDRIAGLLIGADDYMAKPVRHDEVLVRIRRLLERSAPGERTNGLPRLTARENQVLRLFAEGLAQDEIAARLFISAKTVGTHIENIMRKLGVKTRTQAVARAYRDELAGLGQRR